jgi:hypothetical protein
MLGIIKFFGIFDEQYALIFFFKPYIGCQSSKPLDII